MRLQGDLCAGAAADTPKSSSARRAASSSSIAATSAPSSLTTGGSGRGRRVGDGLRAGAGGGLRFLAGVRDGRFLFASRAAAGRRCQGVYPLFLRAERRESARRWAGPILVLGSRAIIVRERAADRKDYDPHVEATQHASLGSRHGGE